MRTRTQHPPPDRAAKAVRPMRRLQIPFGRLPGIWFAHHLQGAVSSLSRLRGIPLPTLMTVLVIGIALALPGAL
ncbi:MAG: hypothetical protein KAX46_06705, partial [Chromatiaceae bacterium]|nr:hypothetical protein [Chromatiaceae bacterium]